ncbi:zinc transporter 1 [Hypomesus transpacificus]|uniref:zinc transporter 1 n=1 Tax=Hypomesus transpacificus TaxID=137520 RepID=UPI001F07B52D|nr:zinc transporter 1 [Hypomesus transpacificus]
MVDGFHTLFILIHMALPLPHPRLPGDVKKPFLCASEVSPPSPTSLPLSSTPTPSPSRSPQFLSADKTISPIPSHSTPCPPSPLSPPPPTTTVQRLPKPCSPTTPHCIAPDTSPGRQLHDTPHAPAASLPASLTPTHPPFVTPSPPPSLIPSLPPSPHSPSLLQSQRCGLEYSEARLQPVGSMFSSLLLAALCVSVCLEIISHTLQPQLLRRPLLATVVGAVSLLHNLLVLGLGWGSQQGGGMVSGEERSGSLWEDGKVKNKNQACSAEGCMVHPYSLHGPFQEGTLVLCNPGASSVLDPDCPDSTSPPTQDPPSFLGARVPAATPQPCPSQPSYGAPPHSLDTQSDLRQTGAWGSHSGDPGSVASRMGACAGHSVIQTSPSLSPSLQSDQPPHGRPQTRSWGSGCLPALVTVIQALMGSILVIANGLVLLLIPGCLDSIEACGLILYLDPGFSLLAVLVLLTTTLPQVCRGGQLLLQACPPQVRVSELGRRISSVPGVWAVHELHVWQLTESCLVASVHVHCHAGFQTHRCGDLLSGVTKVLQSVGVSCWTIQPEFTPFSATVSSNLDNHNTPPTLIRDTPSQPPHPPCSLACGKSCADKMCCHTVEEENAQPVALSAGEVEEEPQMLVIENTFL